MENKLGFNKWRQFIHNLLTYQPGRKRAISSNQSENGVREYMCEIVFGKKGREISCDLEPGYLQREREGKQERPWRGCPVEGQTAQWEKESSLFKTYSTHSQRETDRRTTEQKQVLWEQTILKPWSWDGKHQTCAD